MDELIIRVPINEIDKLRYALEHVPYSGEEHIDGVINTFIEVLKETISTKDKQKDKLYKITCPECGFSSYIGFNDLARARIK